MGDSHEQSVLKGVVRVEALEDPAQYIKGVLDRVKPEYIARTYGTDEWTDSMHFLKQYARKAGKLVKGGEPDFNNTARMVLRDWQRGRLPYFVRPPMDGDEDVDAMEITHQVPGMVSQRGQRTAPCGGRRHCTRVL